MSDWLRPFLLAVFLLLGQIGAQGHAIGHFSEHHHDQQAPDAPACGECLAYGHLGAAAPAAPLTCPGLASLPPEEFAAPEDCRRPPLPAYLSRAPPFPSSPLP